MTARDMNAKALLAVLAPELERLCLNAPRFGELHLHAVLSDGEVGRVTLGIETARKILPRGERGGSQ